MFLVGLCCCVAVCEEEGSWEPHPGAQGCASLQSQVITRDTVLLGRMRYIGIGFLILIAASGCEAPLPETPPSPDVSTPAVAVSPAEAFDHWKAIAKSALGPVMKMISAAA